jgi:uncharacterized protein YndB with AHSA1/START domain
MATTQIIAEPAVPRVVVTREFAAPRELLFRAYTDPGLLVQWLGPRALNLAVDRFDLRHGGSWRYISSDADGNEYSFHGVFHGTPSPDGIVQTFESEGMPGHVCPETVTFTERPGTTLLTQSTVLQSAGDRDAMLQSDMEHGINESMERLDELLVRLAPRELMPSGSGRGDDATSPVKGAGHPRSVRREAARGWPVLRACGVRPKL